MYVSNMGKPMLIIAWLRRHERSHTVEKHSISNVEKASLSPLHRPERIHSGENPTRVSYVRKPLLSSFHKCERSHRRNPT